MNTREHAELLPLLKRLKLSGVLDSLPIRVQQASDDNLSLHEFLYRLLKDEVERREAKQLQMRLRRASFEAERRIDDFDFSFNPQINKGPVIELATCGFVARHENALLIGPTGTGKSHLAQAIGQRACRAGFETLFVTAEGMFRQLRAARADDTYERVLKRFIRPPLLIIDDLCLRPLREHEPLELYDIIRQRYERSSLVVTSNRDVDELYRHFGEPLLASAAMDRLLHHCTTLILQGRSWRTPKQNPEQHT